MTTAKASGMTENDASEMLRLAENAEFAAHDALLRAAMKYAKSNDDADADDLARAADAFYDARSGVFRARQICEALS